MPHVTLAGAKQAMTRGTSDPALRHDCRSPPGRIYIRKCSMTGSRAVADRFISSRAALLNSEQVEKSNLQFTCLDGAWRSRICIEMRQRLEYT
jgi:hypothetical protein